MFQELPQREGFVPLYNIRTDLALEAKEIARPTPLRRFPGWFQRISKKTASPSAASR